MGIAANDFIFDFSYPRNRSHYMLKSMRKNGVTLALFALGCTAMVVLTNELTRDRIAHQQQLEQLRTLGALLPEGSYDNDLVASCKLVSSREYLGSDEPMPLYTATLKGVHTGYALETVAPDGYSGAIRLIVGTDAKGAVSAVRVLAHKETPGLGDKIELAKSPWIHSFVGRSLQAPDEAGWAVKLVRDFDPSLPEFPGDADRLVQALWNLVRNALESGASNVWLRTRAEHHVLIGDTGHRLALRVEIADDGRGVPDDLAERIFLPLVSGRAEGTGLGLPLAQQVAREHGGSLGYRSRPGHTVFTLLLPAPTPDADSQV